jgi:hypothetical protein
MFAKPSEIFFACILCLGGMSAHAQESTGSRSSGADANVSSPDACKLLTQADLQALFPGRPVTSKGGTLSPLFKGPQYNESCMYTVKLPSPTSKSELTKFATINIVSWGGETDGPRGARATFASMRSMRDKVSADPKINHKIEPLSGIGDEAFLETSDSTITARARKADLIYVVNLDTYSAQTQPNVITLATQIASRWKPDVGVVDAQTPVAANTQVEIPKDTRSSTTAPADQWPSACVLLAPEDVRAVFGDMKIDPPRETMGKLTHESRIDRVETLPKPIRCNYVTSRIDMINGEKRFANYSVTMSVSNVAANEELSKKYYKIARRVGDGGTDVSGLGDEASLNSTNSIVIRKGLLVVEVRVSGGDRDRELRDDGTRRVNELAKIVSTKLP